MNEGEVQGPIARIKVKDGRVVKVVKEKLMVRPTQQTYSCAKYWDQVVYFDA